MPGSMREPRGRARWGRLRKRKIKHVKAFKQQTYQTIADIRCSTSLTSRPVVSSILS